MVVVIHISLYKYVYVKTLGTVKLMNFILGKFYLDKIDKNDQILFI